MQIMKDTLITTGRKKRELYVLLACTIAAYILNIIGIIKYGSPVKELVTQVPLVLLISLIIYIVLAVLRIAWYYLSKLWNK